MQGGGIERGDADGRSGVNGEEYLGVSHPSYCFYLYRRSGQRISLGLKEHSKLPSRRMLR